MAKLEKLEFERFGPYKFIGKPYMRVQEVKIQSDIRKSLEYEKMDF